MNEYYLRVEGVNLANFIYDTNDLNTVRGGGLLLLNAMEFVERVLRGKKVGGLRTVTCGASWGLFSFAAEDGGLASHVADCIRKELNEVTHEPALKALKHATFVVDVLPVVTDGGYIATREKLHALNRWQQMQAPSIAVPSLQDHKASKPVCEVDSVRPSLANQRWVKTERKFVSESVIRRRVYGIRQKQQFYRERAKAGGAKFVNDLDALSNDPQQGNLHHKIALIYLDGNGFGALARKYCTDAKKQKAFDRRIRIEYQQGALSQLLTEIKDGPCWMNAEKIRLETLLWGGDEIIWVVPAWKGWWMLGQFFEITRKENWSYEGQKLTHAAGLVFCHHNAPIHRIKQLAQRLGDLAKTDRTRNLVAYQVLESFDHAGPDVEAFRQRQCPGPVQSGDLLLIGDAMSDLFEPMQWIKDRLPRRQVHKIVESLHDGGTEAPGLIEKIKKQDQGVEGQLERLEKCFGSGYALWLHLLELWDYIDGPLATEKEGADAAS